MEKAAEPMGRYARLGEASNGKDTMTGHWEMMGIKTEKPFITFTEHGFPPELIAELENAVVRELSAIRAPAEQRSSKSWARKKSIRVQ